MAAKVVPYLTSPQRLWGAVGAIAVSFTTAVAARVVLGPNITLVLTLALTSVLFVLPMVNWWAAWRGAEFLTPDDRNKRYQIEVAAQPLWINALMYAVTTGVPVTSWQVLGDSFWQLEWPDFSRAGTVFAIILPVWFGFGFYFAHTARVAALRRLEKTEHDTDVPRSNVSLWKLGQSPSYLCSVGSAFASASVVALILGWWLGDVDVAAFGFLGGFFAGWFLALYFFGQTDYRSEFRGEFTTMADVAGFGLWVGTPLGVVLMAFVWIAQLFATPQALVLTLIGTIGATVGIALWLWALHQMRNWTPGFGDASVGGGI